MLILRERLLNKIKERKQEIADLILRGSSEDYPSYRYLTGKLRGIEDSLEIIREVFRDDES